MDRIRKPVLKAMMAASAALACLLAGCSGGSTRAESQAQTQGQAQARRFISYIDAWGVKGDGLGQLNRPVGMATDTMGNVYFADGANRFVDKFNWEGRPLFSYEEDMLKDPQSITVDSGGAIYVTDSGRNSVVVFLPTGDKLHEVKLKGRGNGENAIGVAVGADGIIQVLDPTADTVTSFSATFRVIRTWEPAASGANPRVRGTAIAVGPDGDVYIVDPGGNRIVRFTEDGKFAGEIDAAIGGAARRLSDQFAVGGGYVFAMDSDGRMLHSWSADGKPKLDLDLATELGPGSRPAPALAISPRKELLVLDAPAARVFRYRVNF